MNNVTLVVGYYNQPGILARQIENLQSYPQAIRDHWWLNVVDDGSQKQPAVVPDDPRISLFRMLVDVPWNDKGARNIGCHEARSDWLLVTDIDHLVPVETATALVEGDYDPKRFYGFERIMEGEGPFRPHENSWFLSKALWDRIGGCDERLSGCYGGSQLWRGRAEQVAGPAVETPHPLILVMSGDAPTDMTRRYPGDIVERRRRREMLVGDPHVLTFPYERCTVAQLLN